MTGIAERYTGARHTSNLKCEPRTRMAAADILISTGWTAQQHEDAMLLWDLVYKGKTATKHALVESLSQKLAGYMLRERLKGTPKRIVQEVLAYRFNNPCNLCGGEGHELVPYTITRSDDVCRNCGGTGKEVPLPRIDAYEWMDDHIANLEHHAAGQVMRRLRDEVDL